MTQKMFEIQFDTTDVVGATETAPRVRVVEVSNPSPAKFGRILIVKSETELLVSRMPMFEMPVVWGWLGRRQMFAVTEDQWLDWYGAQDFPVRNDREQWARDRNRAILDIIASLL